MRIISGKFKGRSIKFLKSLNTRPLKDSVRENIFNILNHSNLINVNIENSNILDLYSGIGSFGIECLSRGAGNVTFVEQDTNTILTLKENISTLSITNKTAIYNSTIENFLMKNLKKKFDIFFLDPPYANNDFLYNLESIKVKNLFNKNHLIIIHREEKSTDNFEKILKIIDVKQYRRSKIIFSKFK